MKNVLITGATGFIGEHLFNELKKRYKLFLLVRKNSISKIDTQINNKNVFIIEGDICELNSLLEISIKPDFIIHAAALYDTSSSRNELERTNVKGTKNVLTYAKKIRNLECLCHISTIYVSGDNQNVFPEDSLPVVRKFHNHYEETKYEGEKLVRESKLPFIIYRPPIVVGHSKTGEIKKFNGLYKTLNIIKSGRLYFYPGDCHGELYVSPVDIVSSFIAKTFFRKEFIGKTFNMIEEKPTTYREFINRTAKYLNIAKPYFTFPGWIWKLSVKISGIRSLGIFNQNIKYDNSNYLKAMKIIKNNHPKLNCYFNQLMEYYTHVK